MREQREQLLGRARLTEQPALAEVTVVAAQELELALRLDPFRDDLHAETAAHLDDGAHDGRIPASSVASRTKDWSIFSVPMGNCCSADSEE